MLFFYLWIFLSVMILLNIFVAILMDGYAEAKDEGQAHADRAGLEAPDAVYDDMMTAVRKMFKKLDKRARHYTDHILLSILMTIDEDMPAPVHARKQYRKSLLAELSQLRQDRQTIDACIAFLENMTQDDIEDLPYHHIWQDKHVSFEEIYQRLKKHPDLRDVCNFDDMRDVYHSSVRYALSASR